ncbi:unannotated protein [freshwater metagenome]|uniref:Unannotated protein n=1 Tax=freshwater metagenome TaxID=449393 RepID=A0A6J6D935_9ZZZZ
MAVMWVPLRVLSVFARVAGSGSIGFSGRAASAFLAQSAAGTTLRRRFFGSKRINSATSSSRISGTSQSKGWLSISASKLSGISTVAPSSGDDGSKR